MDDTEEPTLGFAPAPAKAEAYPACWRANTGRVVDFTGLIGQEALVRTLRNAFATGRIAHAFMLTGVRGVGKDDALRASSRAALNCVGPDGIAGQGADGFSPAGLCETLRGDRGIRAISTCRKWTAPRTTASKKSTRIIDSVRYCASKRPLQSLHHQTKCTHAARSSAFNAAPQDA